MLIAHGHQLKKIPMRTVFTIGGWEESAKFTSSPDLKLTDLLKWGIENADDAGDVVKQFRRELNTIHEFPVAIVADGVNVLNAPTVYPDPIDPYLFSPNLPASRLTLSKIFSDFENHGLINGVYIGTTSSIVSRAYDIRKNFPKANVVDVPQFSREEILQLVNFYKEQRFFAAEVTTETSDYLWAMSCGNPQELWRRKLLSKRRAQHQGRSCILLLSPLAFSTPL